MSQRENDTADATILVATSGDTGSAAIGIDYDGVLL